MPVGGTVTLDGKPLSGVVVALVPAGATPGNGANGYTDAADKYELVAPRGGKGTHVGKYQIVVMRMGMGMMTSASAPSASSSVTPSGPDSQKGVPSRYSNRQQTPLTATVHEGDNTENFDVTSK